jgi:hypothetical protein
MSPDEQAVCDRLASLEERLSLLLGMWNDGEHGWAANPAAASTLYREVKDELQKEQQRTSDRRSLTEAEQRWYAPTVREMLKHLDLPTNGKMGPVMHSAVDDAHFDVLKVLQQIRRVFGLPPLPEPIRDDD